MSGYAAAARLHGTPIHAGPALAAPRRNGDRDTIESRSRIDAGSIEQTPQAPMFEERLHYVRQAWAQTTFFLFDPESWR